MTVFWDVAPWSLVEVFRRFRGACCLHHQGDLMMETASTSETSVNFYQATRWSPWWCKKQASLKCRFTFTRLHGTITQKTVTFIHAAVRTWNLSMIVNLVIILQRKCLFFISVLDTKFVALNEGSAYCMTSFIIRHYFTNFFLLSRISDFRIVVNSNWGSASHIVISGT
jgi:hypothetical protein